MSAKVTVPPLVLAMLDVAGVADGQLFKRQGNQVVGVSTTALGLAADSAVAHLAGAETIAGAKAFTSPPALVNGVTLNGQALTATEPGVVATMQAVASSVSAEAAIRAQGDTDSRARANHTGTQTLATISDAGNAASRNVGSGSNMVAPGDDAALVVTRQLYSISRVDYVGATDRTADVQAAFDAIRTLGDAVVLPSGMLSVQTGVLHIDRPCKVVGAGGGSVSNVSGPGAAVNVGFVPGGTTLITTATTGDIITVNASGCTFEDFAICNLNASAQAPTSGAGLLLNDCTGHHLTRVSLVGLWVGAHFVNGYSWTATDGCADSCGYAGFLIEDVAIPDGGDPAIMGYTFAGYLDRNPGRAAVVYKSGGGLKFIGNKINAGYQSGLELSLSIVGTSDLIVVGNSIENCAGYAVVLGFETSGQGEFSNVVIHDNQISLGSGGVNILPSCGLNLARASIANNQFSTLTGKSVWVQAGQQIHVGRNLHTGVGTAVQIEAGTYHVTVDKQNMTNGGAVIVNNAPAGGYKPSIALDYDYPLQVGDGHTSNDIFTAALGVYTGGSFSFDASGLEDGVGTFVYHASGSFTRDGGTPTLTIDNSYLRGSAAASVQGSVALKTGNVLTLTIATTSNALHGVASIKIDGEVQSFAISTQ